MFIILFTLFIFIGLEKFLIDKKKCTGKYFGIFLLFNFSESTKQKYTEFFERIVVSKNHNSQDLFNTIFILDSVSRISCLDKWIACKRK